MVHTLHHVFLTRYGVYLLTFNMKELLGAQNHEALRNLMFWLNSVGLHAKEAPVILVGTFADQIRQTDLSKINDILVQDLKIRTNNQVCSNQKESLWFFPIDNTGKNGDQGIKLLRIVIENVVRNDPSVEKFDMDFVRKPVKIAWIHFVDMLLEKKVATLPLEDVMRTASKCRIGQFH